MDHNKKTKQGPTDANINELVASTEDSSAPSNNSPISDQEKDIERDAQLLRHVSNLRDIATQEDPNLVNWDGPNDPENPMNFAKPRKIIIIAIVSAITFLSSLASSVFAPGIAQIMDEFGSSNEELSSFIVSVFVIGYCFGPLFIAPLSEIYGRAIVYQVCNFAFVIFNIACAVAPSLASLIILRCLAGLAGSCPMTLGAGTIADLIPYEQRGKYIAVWVMGPLLGPITGPIAGGYLSQAKGWRWSLWLVVILSGFVMIFSVLFLRETYPYTILNKKTKRLRRQTGNNKLHSILEDRRTAREIFTTAIVRPTKMLLFSPIIFLLSLYMAVLYGYLYLVFTALPPLFIDVYGFSTGNVGLTYIGLGLGSLGGIIISGALSDKLVQILKKKHGGEPKPEYRLPIVAGAAFCVPIGLFWFGWTAETQQHWILPIIGTFFLGLGMTTSFMPITTYFVDAYGAFAASAVAAGTVLRSLGGAVLPLAGGKMFKELHYGWGASLLAFIALALLPVPALFYKYGERVRHKTFFNVKF